MVRYGGGSPTILLLHLDMSYPGHREALEQMMKDKSGGGAAGTAVMTSTQMMTAYGKHSKWPAWNYDLIRFIVFADRALSMRFEECYS